MGRQWSRGLICILLGLAVLCGCKRGDFSVTPQDPHVVQGLDRLKYAFSLSGDDPSTRTAQRDAMALAAQDFYDAYTANPSSKEANFFYAYTLLYMTVEDSQFHTILGKVGLDPLATPIVYPASGEQFQENIRNNLTFADTEALRSKLAAQLDAILDHLALAEGVITAVPSSYGYLEVDDADVKALESAVAYADALLQWSLAYAGRDELISQAGLHGHYGETLTTLLHTYPELGGLAPGGTTRLATARNLLYLAVDKLRAGLESMEAETDPQGNDLLFLASDADSHRAHMVLANCQSALASLDGPVTACLIEMSEGSTGGLVPLGGYLYPQREWQDYYRTLPLDLSSVFAGTATLRSALAFLEPGLPPESYGTSAVLAGVRGELHSLGVAGDLSERVEVTTPLFPGEVYHYVYPDTSHALGRVVQIAPIGSAAVDGSAGEWTALYRLCTDPLGDVGFWSDGTPPLAAAVAGADLAALSGARDPNKLYFYVQTAGNPQVTDHYLNFDLYMWPVQGSWDYLYAQCYGYPGGLSMYGELWSGGDYIELTGLEVAFTPGGIEFGIPPTPEVEAFFGQWLYVGADSYQWWSSDYSWTDYSDWTDGWGPESPVFNLAAAPADWDGDGLTDAQEFALGTNPANADTDHDGLSDGYEVAHPPCDPLRSLADINKNGAVNGTDFALFKNYFAQRTAQADVNGDGKVNGTDFALFKNAFGMR